MKPVHRRVQVCVLGSAEPGSRAYELAGDAGEALAKAGITLVSGCGSPATRVAAERAIRARGLVLSIVPAGEMPPADWPATVVLPCGMGDARNLLMALAGDACIVIGGRAGTKSEVHLAWLHKRPLLPLVGCGGWSQEFPPIRPTNGKTRPFFRGVRSRSYRRSCAAWDSSRAISVPTPRRCGLLRVNDHRRHTAPSDSGRANACS